MPSGAPGDPTARVEPLDVIAKDAPKRAPGTGVFAVTVCENVKSVEPDVVEEKMNTAPCALSVPGAPTAT